MKKTIRFSEEERKMKKGKTVIALLIAAVIMVTYVSTSFATLNVAGDGFEDRYSTSTGLWNGAIYDTYVNSGTLLGVHSGNANPDNPADVQSYLRTLPGYSNIVLSIYTGNVTGDIADKQLSGTWATTGAPPPEIEFYAVKAANFYGLYLVDPAASSGTWSTYDVWRAGATGQGYGLSHFVGYNPTSVPEPTSLLLLGLGLIGVGAAARKKIKK